jgi:outer membrane cobalamin receptor
MIKAYFISALFFCLPILGYSQANISGNVTDNNNHPVAGASVYLKNTLDGGTSDNAGLFNFTTTEKGKQLLIVTYLGEQKDSIPLDVSGSIAGLHLKISLTKSLQMVVVSAGSFEVSDDQKTALKPMDIMGTAGAGADISRAIQTLPGVQQPGAATGLFVRGGDAGETAILIDGMTVQNAFFSSLPGVSQSTRFSPFQFKGIAFSSGGYSARYGQALSSVLELNTTDGEPKDKISLGATLAGIYGSGAKTFDGGSIGVAANYNNLRAFYGLGNSNIQFYNPPETYGLSLRYTYKPNKDGILKVYANGSGYRAGLKTPDPFLATDSVNFNLQSNTYLSSISYKQLLGSQWNLFTSGSYSYNMQNAGWTGANIGEIPSNDRDYRLQYRLEATRYFSTSFNLLAGAEVQRFGYQKSFNTLSGKFTENILSAYTEAGITPVNWLAVRPGLRYEYSRLLGQGALEPRVSIAARITEHTQAALAGGTFFEDPNSRYLLSGNKPRLEQAIHYIADWEWINSGYTLRLETYYKDYRNLVRELNVAYNPGQFSIIDPKIRIDNTGYGYARGAELFWRDKKSIANFDYWISYSFIDTKRLYSDFPAEATPAFVSKNNLNVVTKYFAQQWSTSFSVTYTYGSGRPYYNPGSSSFLKEQTPAYQNVALSVGRLARVKNWFTVVFLGVDNVFDDHNIFGYRYSVDGQRKYPIVPALYRSFIIGFNISLTQFDKNEL